MGLTGSTKGEEQVCGWGNGGSCDRLGKGTDLDKWWEAASWQGSSGAG